MKNQTFSSKIMNYKFSNQQDDKKYSLLQTQSTLNLPKYNQQKLGLQLKRKISKQIVSIDNQLLEKQIQLYNWRCKTDLPISKVYSFKILSNKSHSNNKTILEITYQTPLLRLNQLGKLPLFQILYLLKQSFIGFQRLVDKIGFFYINQQMIILNKSQKCKVWWNENIPSNSFNSIQGCSSTDFLQMFYKIFEKHTLSSATSFQFFSKIRQSSNIGQAILFLDRFTKQKKIIVVNSLKLSFSPSKLNFNRLTSSRLPNQNPLAESTYVQPQNKINPNNSFFKLQSSLICNKPEGESKRGNKQSFIIPKFLSKNSLEESTFPSTNPQDTSKSFLCKSKSYNYFKNLKSSTFTKLDKSKYDISSTSFDGSNSQITVKSTKKMDNFSSQSNLWTTRTPKNKTKNKQKKDFSFKKDSLEKDSSFYDKKVSESFIDTQKQFRQRKYSNQVGLQKKNNCDYKFKGVKIGIPTLTINEQVYEQNKNLSLENSIEPNKDAPFKNLGINKDKIKQTNHKNQYKVTLNNQNLFSSSKNIFINFNQKKENGIKISSQTIQSITKPDANSTKSNQPLTNIFEKNGWKMQIQSLIDNGVSMRESIKDGKQQRSHFLGTTFDFEKLAKMGRRVQGSMVPDDQFRSD